MKNSVLFMWQHEYNLDPFSKIQSHIVTSSIDSIEMVACNGFAYIQLRRLTSVLLVRNTG